MHRAVAPGGTSKEGAGAAEEERWSVEVEGGTVGDTAAASHRVQAEGATGKTGGGDVTAGAAGMDDVCRNVGAGAGRKAWGGSYAEGGEEAEEAGAAADWPAGTLLRCAVEGASAVGNTETGSWLVGDPSGGSDPGRSWEAGAEEAARRWAGTWEGVGA